ncbi:MAG: dihydropteroate synthase, partial [Clostridium sp.]|nr:dihydropteroate synthase [Clostridium sp.]
TPDSFSDGGKYTNIDAALYRVETMIEEGADLLDIGGESTRPGHQKISAEEEIDRVTDIIFAIKARFDIPLSLDTYKAKVARAGLQAGVDMINDIWGLRDDPEMAKALAEADCPCVLMHNAKTRLEDDWADSFFADLRETITVAMDHGIKQEHILLDPGIGFAKSTRQNLAILQELHRLRELGYPILVGVSRKTLIGDTLQLPVDQRLEGTMAITAWAWMKDCMFVRVHDVLANRRLLDMLQAINPRRNMDRMPSLVS